MLAPRFSVGNLVSQRREPDLVRGLHLLLPARGECGESAGYPRSGRVPTEWVRLGVFVAVVSTAGRLCRRKRIEPPVALEVLLQRQVGQQGAEDGDRHAVLPQHRVVERLLGHPF
jgi:hypothetical protein